MALKLSTSGNGVHLSNPPRPRQALADFRLSDRLAMSFETKAEADVRRVYFNVGDDRMALDVARGNRSQTEIAGHKLVVDDGQLYIDDRRFDFDRRDFSLPKTSKPAAPPSPEQQLANLEQRFPKAKFIGDASNLASMVIGEGVKIEGTVHLVPGTQIAEGTRIAPDGVVKGGIISGSLIFGRVEGGQITNSMIDGGAKVTGGVLNKVEMSRDAEVTGGVLTETILWRGSRVSGGNLRRMTLEKGAKVTGGDLRDFQLGEGQSIAGGRHHGSKQVDTEKLRAAGSVLRKVDRSTAQAALQALSLGLDEATHFRAENPHESRVKREVKSTLTRNVAQAKALLEGLERATSKTQVSGAMEKLDGVAKEGADAMARLRKLSAGGRVRSEATPPPRDAGIDPDLFRKYVETTLMQLGPLPAAAPIAQGMPTYTQALLQMQYADLARAYQPQATGYPPQLLQNYGQHQMPPYLFGAPQPSPQVMTTIPPQYPQQPSGWGKAAMLGGAGLLLGLGLGSFGMGTFGLGMGMFGMGGMGMLGMGGMGMLGMGGMGMLGMGGMGMGMFGF
jgi:hypothetical protein